VVSPANPEIFQVIDALFGFGVMTHNALLRMVFVGFGGMKT
jgi:hypothetical protein